jgi:phage regulator Rha-like protein
MSSREISELVEQRHDNVKRTIETLGSKGVITLPQFEEVPNTSPGPKTIGIYRLGKRDSLIVVAQLCPEFTARIVDRWQELEAQQPQPLSPANFTRLQLIELAMQAEQERIESEKKRMALEVKVEAMAPQVEALERIALSDGSLCITDAAKTLQVAPREFAKLLHEWGWTYRRPMGKDWLAHQDRIRSNHMEHKVTTGEKSDGGEWSKTQARVTPKGLTRLAELLAKQKNNTTPTPLTPSDARNRGAA